MVKVISAYNFQEQNIYSTSGDITATCLVGLDRLAIAHRNHIVEILSLRGRVCNEDDNQNENQPLSNTAFPTVDQVEQIEYCLNGAFLVTLESKCNQNDELQLRFVRVYTNFDVVRDENCFETPMRARIASKVTPKNCSSTCIEVIELPIYSQTPNVIACCQASGTIVISCGNTLYFYELRVRSNDVHKFSFIDFFEFPFNIKLDFIPLKLTIAEHIVACLNESTAVALKVVDLSESNTEDGSTSNSMATDSSSNYVYNRSNEPIDFEVAKKCNQVNGIEFRSELGSNWDANRDSQSSFSEERPILVNDIKIDLNYPDVINVPNDRLYYSVRSLVQLRIPKTKFARQIYDEFRCLALKPIYHKKNLDEATERGHCYHFMKSTLNSRCVGFSLFLTTVSDGYLYQFSNQGKWYTENMKCLATYPFTAPVIDVIIDNFVIHAVTESGIETFSSRIGHKLFSSYFEYPMMSNPYPSETSPLVDVPICVMGICGFFGVKYVVSSHKKLILFSTDKERNSFLRNDKKNYEKFEPEWTIYDLQLPKPEALVLDILNLANLYNHSNPDIYFELLEEAHIIARLGRELRINNSDIDYISPDLEKIYMETCQLLADFTIQSERKDTYSQAVAYYIMCKQPVWAIYQKYCGKQIFSTNSTQAIGLIYTLKLLLSRTASSKSDSDYLNSSISPTVPLNSTNLLEHTIAEELLIFFKTYAPSEVASISLISPVFREILHEQLLDLFSKREKLKSDEKLCLILCFCRKNNVESALRILETMTRKEIFQTLKEHWLLMFDNYNPDNYRRSSFSDLTENVLFVSNKTSVVEAISDIFIHLLIIAQYIDLDFLLKLFMNYFAVYLGHKGYRISQNILEIILQAYFNDLYDMDRPSVKMLDISTQNSDPILTQSQSTLAHEYSNENIKNLVPNWICSSGNKINRNNSRFSEDSPSTSTIVDSNYEDPEFEGLKVLFRMYLGFLKQHSGDEISNNGKEIENNMVPEVMGYRLAFIDYMYRNLKAIKSAHFKLDRKLATSYQTEYTNLIPNYDGCDSEELESVSFRRPILFLERRKIYLNKMPPFDQNSFKLDADNIYYFDDWDKEVNVIILKLQAMLSSGRLDSSFLDDFIAFSQSNPNVTGIDSLITILLPKPEGVEFLIHVNPGYLLPYSSCRLTTNNQWQVLFKRIVKKKRDLSKNEEKCVLFYDGIIKDILQSLLEEKPLEEFLSCIPDQEINLNYIDEKEHNQRQLPTSKDGPIHSQDGIDENNPFQFIIREAVAKQRSDALCAMIQSTGKQLFDAVNSYQLHLN